MARILRALFILLFVKPLVFIGLGLNIINRQNLPMNGPVVVAANHNSHLDTLVLLALFPISIIYKVRPVAAADYFLSNPIVAWLSLNVIGIIPIRRSPSKEQKEAIFDECHKALEQGDILIIFPEGSRGEPEVMSGLKKGIYHLVKDHPQCAVVPVVMRGLGVSLPKGTAMFVPFNCDVVLGDSVSDFSDADEFIEIMQEQYQMLSEQCIVQVE
ncbi:1-acyl-sn-glycerol-3-phosphate acyltransferase [Vibrio europaeus]|uniref:1-acyl-sn-glycerol-3-phosphate acyltransferase n=1 Tax=Vibrio europaeus TaxID=300876 RepID=A0A178JFY2_9VIBR|nr:lysophospholipid acyltransferase family protein [Vibrio europaeus]MDC5707283.1 lysophospholipid acyltransferase family protein [Vibrio europaeus]MDC5712648.1 1-acyl-sn-glycerol-3-phosphate acyltransferase [Vibrio europaeus]MDC5717291.1 1-acyl-sn-glycerol-3-phosphate acyltransferase [Vibrio europaeus]MDC5721175.1 1-acyl-sn-glycerol-3-phosphate acyltransferase [Vibrio europaeus]MDC5726591.1 1-acyl-sn-glycerol-3-phosphate acyltransferase [Vibrio europaeus]